MQDYGFIDKYNELRATAISMIDADRTSLLGDWSWLQPTPWDINHIEESNDGAAIIISGSTWTNRFGGSSEAWDATIPKADIELFRIKQLLAPVTP